MDHRPPQIESMWYVQSSVIWPLSVWGVKIVLCQQACVRSPIYTRYMYDLLRTTYLGACSVKPFTILGEYTSDSQNAPHRTVPCCSVSKCIICVCVCVCVWTCTASRFGLKVKPYVHVSVTYSAQNHPMKSYCTCTCTCCATRMPVTIFTLQAMYM